MTGGGREGDRGRSGEGRGVEFIIYFLRSEMIYIF